MLGLTLFIFVAFAMFFMGTFVLIHDPSQRSNRLFFGWVTIASAWMAANYLENVVLFSEPLRTMFFRMDLAFGALTVALIFLFVYAFIGRFLNLLMSLYVIAPAFVLAVLSFTSLFPTEISFSSLNELNFVGGPVFDFVYSPIVLLYLVVPCTMLIREGLKGDRQLRAQRLLVGAGLTVSTVVATVMNLFFQNSVSVETLRLGIYVFILFLLTVTISVVRHEFLKVRFLFVEIIFLLVLATTLARLILSQNLPEVALNATYFMVMLISGFAMMRLFIRDYDRWKKIGELAADLAVANEELRELDRLKSDFVSIASHQLRTPVSVMKGYLSLIGEGAYGKVTPEIREKVGQMYRMNDRLVHLINNMLNVSRIEKERIDFSCSGFDLDDVIVDIVDEMSYKAKEKGLSLAFTKGADDKTAHVHADKEKVSEVLTNLIDNAVKYTERGGITLSVAVDLKKEIAEVRVTDTGLGVPADAMRHLFGKFYRAKRDVNLRTQGTGLGLYVCKTFVEGMGGTIVVEKTSERGTTFMFTVPMVPKGACAEDLG